MPSASKCPYCGGEPKHNPENVLGATGYTYNDVKFKCRECDEEWTCGVPIGEHDGTLAEELFCASCETRYGLPHRIKFRSERVAEIHMKCPECFYFWKIRRETDKHNVILFGFPQITGSIEDADAPLGYDESLPEFEATDD